jgi:hypothetical protein
MADFSNYELGVNVYELADGVLPEIAHALEFETSREPSTEELQALIGHIGPAKTLQDNIARVQERLGTDQNAVALAADWVERSGVLQPLIRSIARPDVVVPRLFDEAFIGGGVARWMLRRVAQAEDVTVQGLRIGQVTLPLGQRQMGEAEHDLVKEYAVRNGTLPTEVEFGRSYILPRLRNAGLNVRLLDFDSQNGDEIMRMYAESGDLNDGLVLALANAPSAIQTAGQCRIAAREVDGDFDHSGRQLFVASDTIDVARQGEPAATHQNPFSALGQIARNALFLHKNM